MFSQLLLRVTTFHAIWHRVTCSILPDILEICTISNSTLYVPCIMFQCVDKPTRCNTSYDWSLLSIIWLYIFRTIASPSPGASSHKLYNSLVRSCYQASLAVAWMYNNSRLIGDWRRATAVPVYKRGDRSLVTNYRPVSVTSVVCKQMEQL